MKVIDTIQRLRSSRPFDVRFWLDDQLLSLYNAMQRAKEPRLPPELKSALRRNRVLRGRHGGQRCYVIGNGPSLNEQDLTRLRDEVTFVVNRFIHHPDAEAINPTYYCIVDPKFGAGSWGTDFVEQLVERLPNVTLLLTFEGLRFLEERGLATHHDKYVLYPNQHFHFGYDREIDLSRGIPGASNVTKAALSAAVYMGCSRINLLGVDGNGLVLQGQSHFYGKVERSGDQQEFEKDLVSMSMGLRGWRAISDYLEQRGVDLVSMNPRSVLTGLRFVPFE